MDETPKTQQGRRWKGVFGTRRQLPTAAAQTRLIKECKFRKITRHCLAPSRSGCVPPVDFHLYPAVSVVCVCVCVRARKGVEIFSINNIINGPPVARSKGVLPHPQSALFVFVRRVVVWEFSGFLLTAARSLASFSISATAAAPDPAHLLLLLTVLQFLVLTRALRLSVAA